MPVSKLKPTMGFLQRLLIICVAILPITVHGQNEEPATTESDVSGSVDVSDVNGCSYHRYYSCHEDATCTDVNLETLEWRCDCPEGMEGDGYIRNGVENTGCGKPKCKFDKDCHSLAVCGEAAHCDCQSGYLGDGITECIDLDECNTEKPCHKHATCTNTEGSYICVCQESQGYVGNGFTCQHRCSVNYDCGPGEMCEQEVCVCKPGYEEVLEQCQDIDECLTGHECNQNAECINEEGSYICVCRDGFEGDGLSCKPKPRNCQDIKDAKKRARSGEYEIDPDGPGPLGMITVECEMRPGLGITVFETTKSTARVKMFVAKKNRPRYNVKYINEVEDIKAVVAGSVFCYQSMVYLGRNYAVLMDGDDYWVDGNGNQENNWGGSPVDGKCACGAMGYCEDRTSACNCDGNLKSCSDSGKIIDKTKLPVLAAAVHPGPKGYGGIQIGPVMCGQVSFDLPQTCHEAKFDRYMNIRKDGPLVLDFDGPGGLYPVLAYCDMKSFNHVGITIIPNINPHPTDVSSAGEIPVEYTVDRATIDQLLNNSDFCMQTASYECKNSRLLNNGNRKGWFSDLRGEAKDYWPGALQRTDQCACGLLGICDDQSYGCSCDVKDGQVRKDFGAVYHKEDLPIGSLTFTEIGGSSTGTYTVGPLMCSGREFGIPPTCQQYADDGYEDSYVYLIDPDGPENPRYPDQVNHPWFPVYCDINVVPPYATTVVYHDQLDEMLVSESGQSLALEYAEVSLGQLDVLVKRSVSCTQALEYECTAAPLHDANSGEAFTTWSTMDGRALSYFAGTGVNGTGANVCQCALDDPASCPLSKLSCNCDKADSVTRNDDGVLSNKEDLPMMSLNFTNIKGAGQAKVKVGPLECRELFISCGERKLFNNGKKLESEAKMKSGYYTIDPDGPGGVEPFSVECLGTRSVVETFIEVTKANVGGNDEGMSKCYSVYYKSNGMNVTNEQVQALVDSSLHCGQQLGQSCLNAPLTGHSNFSTCDGQVQEGWAGSRGEDMCACGVTGGCEGGPSAKCNCDIEDGEMRSDGSWMLDKHRLAVCEVCVSLEAAGLITSGRKFRSVVPTVSDLFCDIGGISGAGSCQDWRNFGMEDSDTQMVQPPPSSDNQEENEPFPVFCRLQGYPPMGITEIRPKEPVIDVPSTGIDEDIAYFAHSLNAIQAVINSAGYCTQSLHVRCQDSGLELGGTYGWYSSGEELQVAWAGNYDGTPTCAGGECNCNSPGNQEDGGLIIDSDLLPVRRVKLGPATGSRQLVVGPVQCYDLYRNCHEILLAKAKTDPMGNNTYAIDPDQAGGVDPFAVQCDFESYRAVGITKVDVEEVEAQVFGNVMPDSFHEAITYDSVTYDQINALVNTSEFCMQTTQYHCIKSPLILSGSESLGYYSGYGGAAASHWGVAGDPNTIGCACVATGSCPEGKLCHCDGQGNLKVDYGFETDMAAIPIESVTFGGQAAETSSALFNVSDVWCGPQPVYLPEDCEEAYEMGYKSGEVLILPTPAVEPFLVHCNMDQIARGKGVTIVNSHQGDGEDVPYTDDSLPLTYYQADYEQLRALVAESEFCYQPFKYICRNTEFLAEEGVFYWRGGEENTERTYVGSGRWFERECDCGAIGQCGGSEPREELMAMGRKCNCDAGDNETRADAGIFSDKSVLPIRDLYFAPSQIADTYGQVVVGSLYCAEEELDLNECNLGFHDCHEQAKCMKQEESYDCLCKQGWRGLGRPDVWANGRNCYDDDECALFMCPVDKAVCTNYPGGYDCTCHEGYNQLSKHRCQDIDECALGTHNCSENGRCINLMGSYDCRCNYNYRGDGYTCEPMAVCQVFGDPHILTFDGRLVDYQGACRYLLARDNCDALSMEPTFELLATFSSRDVETRLPATWVEQLTFKLNNYSIDMLQGGEVRVDGRTVNLPYSKFDINIRLYGKYVEIYMTIGVELVWDGDEAVQLHTSGQWWDQMCGLEIYTTIGVELVWDGDEAVQLHTSGQWRDQMCGLCGNYNVDPDDDLETGPACPDDAGNLASNNKVFGDSWMVGDYGGEECSPDCDAEEEDDACKGTALQMAKHHCGKLYNKNGKFKDCLIEMDSNLVDLLEHSCIYDLCRIVDDPSDAVCNSAKALVETCLLANTPVESFRSDEFCEITCEENMEYEVCGSTLQLTCYDVVTNNTVAVETPECQEGCFCKEGYVLDGTVCVEPEECGCLYEDEYRKLGEEVSLGGCDEKATCLPGNVMERTSLACHPNAVCSLQDGRFGCHCEDMYYGDGMDMCFLEACYSGPCGANQTCLRNPMITLGYECVCAEGFVGDCDNCEEVDECSTYENLCPGHADCINTVGSFDCKCHDGYTLFGGLCQDINECALAKAEGVQMCGNNSQCVNTMGGAYCACCAGYEKDEDDNCIGNEGAEGERCCTCDTEICRMEGKVCSEDFVEYPSFEAMVIDRCERGMPAREWEAVNYFGRCTSSCAAVECPMYQECVVDDVTGSPTCECVPCTQEEVSSDKVCTSKLDMYPNVCVFKQIQCKLDHEAVPLESLYVCESNEGEIPVGDWSGWGECSVSCGLGSREQTREAYRDLNPTEQDRWPLKLLTECNQEPCPGSACLSTECQELFSSCVEVTPGVPQCRCPACTNIELDPACGFVQLESGDIVTSLYESACHLQKEACENGYTDAGVLNEGHCNLMPLNCTRAPEKGAEYVRGGQGNKYVSRRKVAGFGCLGGCGTEFHDCCRPSDTKMKNVVLYNEEDSEDTITVQVEIVKSCECVPLEDLDLED